MKKAFNLFLAFFKIGAFTFGGGYAMIPIIEREMVVNKKWINKDEFIDILSISQSLPGAISINASISVGYKTAGLIGAILALIGVALPAFLSIIVIAIFLNSFTDNIYIAKIFKGVNAAIPILILMGVLSLVQNVPKTKVNIFIFILVTILLTFSTLNPIYIIISGIIFSYFYYRKKVK